MITDLREWWFNTEIQSNSTISFLVILTKTCHSSDMGDVYDMMTSSNGNIFRVTVPLCGDFTRPCEFPTQSPVTRSFDVFFDMRLNKRLSKQPWGWWFETPWWSLWRHSNDITPNDFRTPSKTWTRGFCLLTWSSLYLNHQCTATKLSFKSANYTYRSTTYQYMMILATWPRSMIEISTPITLDNVLQIYVHTIFY